MANFINDSKMVYDVSTHRYILLEDYFNEYWNVNLTDILINKTDVNKDVVSKVFLRRVSNVFYNYIFRSVQSKEKAEYMFSLPRYRDAIMEGMLELGYSFIMNNKDNTVLLDEVDSKQVPSGVENICMVNGLFNRHFMRLPYNYKDTKGVDW